MKGENPRFITFWGWGANDQQRNQSNLGGLRYLMRARNFSDLGQVPCSPCWTCCPGRPQWKLVNRKSVSRHLSPGNPITPTPPNFHASGLSRNFSLPRSRQHHQISHFLQRQIAVISQRSFFCASHLRSAYH